MITLEVRLLKNSLSKSIGLLGQEKADSVYFKTRFGIHTLGMKFPIDVLILDDDYKIVKLTENLKPNRIFLWSPKFDNIVELPAGEIKKNSIKLGDKIKLEINPS